MSQTGLSDEEAHEMASHEMAIMDDVDDGFDDGDMMDVDLGKSYGPGGSKADGSGGGKGRAVHMADAKFFDKFDDDFDEADMR